MADCQLEIKLFVFILFSTPTSFHYVAEPSSIIRGVWSDGKHLLTRRNIDNSLKIKAYPAPSIQSVSSNLKGVIFNKLLPDALAYFSKTLSTRRRISPLRLQRQCKKTLFKTINGTAFRYCENVCEINTFCGEVLVPEEHLDVCRTCDSSKVHCTDEISKATGQVETDFLLYVSANETSQCRDQKDLVAYAASCQLEQAFDRPVAGFVNICVDKLSGKFEYSHLLTWVKHEIFHALGFSSSLYGYYRADDGTPLTRRLEDGRPATKWSNKVVREITRDDWKVSQRAGSSVRHSVHMIVTPRVVKEVRAHFNCSTLEGAEIENQGRDGQLHTHLEKRVFENEAMTGVFTNNPVFSRITLAVMEDTGWYLANYDMAKRLDWGYGAGCIFAQNSCKAWMDYHLKTNGSISPYCTQLSFKDHTRTGCTHNNHGVGICNIAKYLAPLPRVYQYFDSLPGVDTPTHYGGSTMLADYCPYYQELDWKKNGAVIRGSSCKLKSNMPSSVENYALEVYGKNSACFLQGSAWTSISCFRKVTDIDWGSGCYSYTCTNEGLTASISGQSFPCLFAGQILDVGVIHNNVLYEGSIMCPACEVLCGNTCPSVESTYLYNRTISENSQNVLVCSSGNLRENFGSFVLFVLLSIIVGEIQYT